MRVRTALLLASCAVLLVPVAGAALNGPLVFKASFAYRPDPKTASNVTLVSGAMRYEMRDVEQSFGFFDASPVTMTGLTQVCYAQTCRTSATGQLSLVVTPSSSSATVTSFGFRFPNASGRATADHVLAVFQNFQSDNELNGLGLGRALLAPAINGKLAVDADAIPNQASGSPNYKAMGGLAALEETTSVELRENGNLITTLKGKQASFGFAGRPDVPTIVAAMLVLPMDGAPVSFTPAGATAASQGLKFERLQLYYNRLINARPTAQAEQAAPIAGVAVLSDVLNGAIVRVPTKQLQRGEFLKVFVLVRFTSLEVAPAGNGLSWSGRASLDVQNGHVAGAMPLLGFPGFAIPWWSILLWAAGLTLWIIRNRLHVQKESKWDQYKWVKWVARPVAILIFLVLWEFETHAIWGTSLAQSRSLQALGLMALLELLPLALMVVAVMAPLRLILRNVMLLCKQGTFMGLPSAAATLLGFPVCAWLLRSYLNVILPPIIGQMSGS